MDPARGHRPNRPSHDPHPVHPWRESPPAHAAPPADSAHAAGPPHAYAASEPAGSPTPSPRPRPILVGITADLAVPDPAKPPRIVLPTTYTQAVIAAGGVPLVLPPVPALAAAHLSLVDAVVLTGGDDPRTEPFGEPTHPAATPVHADRQAYETCLLRLLEQPAYRDLPVLGICLGMQMMALIRGGRLHQHLPDVLVTADRHRHDNAHPLIPSPTPLPSSAAWAHFLAGLSHEAATTAPRTVTSHHHQAVADAGELAVLATSDDGVIEAIADPARPFYLGVQWHPERTPDDTLGPGLFRSLLHAAGARFRVR